MLSAWVAPHLSVTRVLRQRTIDQANRRRGGNTGPNEIYASVDKTKIDEKFKSLNLEQKYYPENNKIHGS